MKVLALLWHSWVMVVTTDLTHEPLCTEWQDSSHWSTRIELCLVYLHTEDSHKPDTVAHSCNPSTQETEARGLPQIQGYLGLHSETVSKQKTTKKKVLVYA